MANSLAISSLYLHRETIDTVQNHKRIQVPEVGEESSVVFQEGQPVYFRELEFSLEQAASFKVRSAHAMAVQLLSKLAKVERNIKMESWHRLKEHSSQSSASLAERLLQKMKQNVDYLKASKSTMKKSLRAAQDRSFLNPGESDPMRFGDGGESFSSIKKQR
mmetsp:Transcript_21800/g.33702  ORF Transcript_21800/g.33702 Transcript_21800/m.33702 type:complete len:162 (+) Transcript_21800:1504-1989(+)